MKAKQPYDAAEAARGAAMCMPLSGFEPKPVVWLWPGRIPRGKITMVGGDPKLGKSLLTAAIAAAVSAGQAWPVDGGKAPQGRVIIASAEDDASDTIRPRVEAAGGDVNNVLVLESVMDVDDDGELVNRPFSLRKDLQRLAAEIRADHKINTLIVDPISAYMAGTDSHKNTDVRELLHPLAMLAAETGIAVICVTHLNKGAAGIQNALYRFTGSLAFTAAARSCYLVARDQGEPSRRLLLPAGGNLAPDDIGGLAYTIETTDTPVGKVPLLRWEPEQISIDTVDALAPDSDERDERSEAAEWLRELLADGCMPAKDVQRAASNAGHAWRTVQRAKKAANVKTTRCGFGKGSSYTWAIHE